MSALPCGTATIHSAIMKLRLPIQHFVREYDPATLEMMDRPDQDPDLLREDLRNLQKINVIQGGHRLIRRELERLLGPHAPRPPSPLRILDLCTGSGDNPRMIVEWCHQRNLEVKITATDLQAFMLQMAREESKSYPEITFEAADVRKPGYADHSFDLVMCHLALHHFTAEDAVGILREMWRITAGALWIHDLHRSRSLTFMAGNLLPFFSRNAMTRFDAHLSTRRAFSWDELLRLAFHAKIPNAKVRRYFGGRQILVAKK